MEVPDALVEPEPPKDDVPATNDEPVDAAPLEDVLDSPGPPELEPLVLLPGVQAASPTLATHANWPAKRTAALDTISAPRGLQLDGRS